MTNKAIISSKDLHVEFGGVKAANGVNLQIHRGQIASIIGPNGSGKTTFLNLCTGYVRPTSGSVHFGEKDLTRLEPRAITRLGIARTFQLPQLFSEQSVLENLLLALAARDGFWTLSSLYRKAAHEEAEELLALFCLLDQAGRQIGSLPEGVRKLVDIAVALALSPTLLLMDEPTSGVSSQEKFEIMDMLVPVLRQRDITALLVEHDMELVERYMDRVIVWNAGQVAADGPPAEILQNEEVLRNVIGGAQ
ncbi:ABC transporter ATP-binding protein [Achromobacter ruhlandii]|jgi:branched-chain amino acid transport system ATP-binding protein|uniref:ABC transporter ATP-binding protein n=1 Tax=Achromobacter TaxID=222 RepID=UPI001467EA9B|nr:MULTISPECIES: ABC transporter ATP-binding protein [Achromobacter]MCV6796804.1 ABC transporter ATP-binding protein [Achromobacter ruhlandii]MCV6800973.1 ABC transporter ATP-binding protein [Achromobacter ruhlandii]MCV6809868.1 ABC transporter ATP-binding protein [Achromobacter ruhlandii]MCV6819119.1 ABC transporter ATP-binding protein [Achromobacter ruhlandii]CAB3874163.1 L-cystine import ATP-binding protein TcyN [Achromobacter mucicolens]